MRELPLVGCPGEFVEAWRQYVVAWEVYGQWIEDHTGIANWLEGSGRSGQQALLTDVDAAYAKVADAVRRYLPDRRLERRTFE